MALSEAFRFTSPAVVTWASGSDNMHLGRLTGTPPQPNLSIHFSFSDPPRAATPSITLRLQTLTVHPPQAGDSHLTRSPRGLFDLVLTSGSITAPPRSLSLRAIEAIATAPPHVQAVLLDSSPSPRPQEGQEEEGKRLVYLDMTFGEKARFLVPRRPAPLACAKELRDVDLLRYLGARDDEAFRVYFLVDGSSASSAGGQQLFAQQFPEFVQALPSEPVGGAMMVEDTVTHLGVGWRAEQWERFVVFGGGQTRGAASGKRKRGVGVAGNGSVREERQAKRVKMDEEQAAESLHDEAALEDADNDVEVDSGSGRPSAAPATPGGAETSGSEDGEEEGDAELEEKWDQVWTYIIMNTTLDPEEETIQALMRASLKGAKAGNRTVFGRVLAEAFLHVFKECDDPARNE